MIRKPSWTVYARGVVSCPQVQEKAEDVGLVRAVAAGDRSALGELYDRHHSVLMAVGMRIVSDRQETEDLLHDVFLEVWKRAHTYDPKRASVRSWLLLRMRSRALDRVKSARMAKRRPMDQAPAETQDASASRDVDAGRIPGWLESLSNEQRDVIALGYFEGLSCREIGERLGIPIGTVKSRLASALRVLRKVAEAAT